jgi:hypothetical protein
MREKYTSEDYHKPSDKIKPYWELSGTVEDLRLLGEVGYRVANGKTFPAWKAGSEFKAKRQEPGVRSQNECKSGKPSARIGPLARIFHHDFGRAGLYMLRENVPLLSF